MQVKLKQLTLKNFKGVKEATYDFFDNTLIEGANGTGKTTIYDAFNWLLFGRDSSQNTNFEIKPKKNKKVQHNLDYSVKGVFEIDGKEISLCKVLKENWVTQRGAKDKEFKGHTTEHFINDLVCKQKEYTQKIEEIFKGDIFKMVSDPLFFPVTMAWKDRRAILFELLGNEIDDEDIFIFNKDLAPLQDELADLTVDQFIEKMRYRAKETKKNVDDIPVKIDALASTIDDTDVELLDMNIKITKNTIQKLEDEIEKGNLLSDKKIELADQLLVIKMSLNNIKNDALTSTKDKVRAYEELAKEIALNQGKVKTLQLEVADIEKKIKTGTTDIDVLEKTMIDTREEYKTEAQRQFVLNEDDCKCPTCQRELENVEEIKAELEANFNKNKENKLLAIQQKGKNMKEEVESIKAKIEILREKKEDVLAEIKGLEESIEKDKGNLKAVDEIAEIDKYLETNKEYAELKEKEKEILAEQETLTSDNEIKEKKDKIAKLKEELEEAVKKKARAEQSDETREKIKELEAEQKKLAQQLLDTEHLIYLAEEFIRARAELIEQGLNKHFDSVEFKLFDEQVNGGLKETCIVMVDGIEFNSANTAGKLNAGLNIIEVLSKHYKYKVPVWIDNRESVTKIKELDTQIINLAVNKNVKKLKVTEE